MFDVIYQAKGERRKSLQFNGEHCRIGSDKKNDLTLRDRRVAKFHAEISEVNKECVIEEFTTNCATFVNGQKIVQPTVLAEADEIVIGSTRIWIHAATTSGSPESKDSHLKAVDELSSHPMETTAESLSSLHAGHNHVTLSNQPASGQSHVNESGVLHWGVIVHERLLKQMDLRRKDVHRMSDQQLRDETENLITEILLDMTGLLPQGLDIEQLKIRVLNEAVGLGPLEKFLADDSISEVMVNNFAEVFVERDGKIVRSEYGFSSDQAVLSVIERIITPIGRRIDESSPMVDARLKDGSRVNAIIAPLTLTGPSLTIRKFCRTRLQFADLVGFGSLSQEMVDFLRVCVETRKNIVVSGGTGSGKTTLLNVLSGFIPDDERIVTVEDAAELQLVQPNLVCLEAKPVNLEGRGEITIRDLLKNTLRMRPDRIVVGECRGGETLDMLQAMNTGHDGCLTTAHANSPRDLISRLEVMVLMSGMSLPVNAIREQVASAVDVIVHQTRFPCGTRKISRITEVVGIESGTVQLQDIFAFNRKGYNEAGKVVGEFQPEGFIPSFYEELATMGTSLDLSIFKNHGEGTGVRY